VKSKDDILDGMIDIVLSEVDLPADEEEWQAGCANALSQPAAFSRGIPGHQPHELANHARRATLKHQDSMIKLLRRRGFLPVDGGSRDVPAWQDVHGFALQEATLPLDDSGDIGAATESILHEPPMMSNAFPT
jgi:hypothetical protein